MDKFECVSAAVELGLVIGDLQNMVDGLNNPFYTSEYDIPAQHDLIAGKLDHIMDLIEQVSSQLGCNDPSVLSIQNKIHQVMDQLHRKVKVMANIEGNCEATASFMSPPDSLSSGSNPFLEPYETSTDLCASTTCVPNLFEETHSAYTSPDTFAFSFVQSPEVTSQSPPPRRASSRNRPSGLALERMESEMWGVLKKLTEPDDYMDCQLVMLQNLETSITHRFNDYLECASLLSSYYERNARATDKAGVEARLQDGHRITNEALRRISLRKNHGTNNNPLSTIDEESTCREETVSSDSLNEIPTPGLPTPQNLRASLESRIAAMDRLLASPFLSRSVLSDTKEVDTCSAKLAEASSASTADGYMMDTLARLSLDTKLEQHGPHQHTDVKNRLSPTVGETVFNVNLSHPSVIKNETGARKKYTTVSGSESQVQPSTTSHAKPFFVASTGSPLESHHNRDKSPNPTCTGGGVSSAIIRDSQYHGKLKSDFHTSLPGFNRPMGTPPPPYSASNRCYHEEDHPRQSRFDKHLQSLMQPRAESVTNQSSSLTSEKTPFTSFAESRLRSQNHDVSRTAPINGATSSYNPFWKFSEKENKNANMNVPSLRAELPPPPSRADFGKPPSRAELCEPPSCANLYEPPLCADLYKLPPGADSRKLPSHADLSAHSMQSSINTSSWKDSLGAAGHPWKDPYRLKPSVPLNNVGDPPSCAKSCELPSCADLRRPPLCADSHELPSGVESSGQVSYHTSVGSAGTIPRRQSQATANFPQNISTQRKFLPNQTINVKCTNPPAVRPLDDNSSSHFYSNQDPRVRYQTAFGVNEHSWHGGSSQGLNTHHQAHGQPYLEPPLIAQGSAPAAPIPGPTCTVQATVPPSMTGAQTSSEPIQSELLELLQWYRSYVQSSGPLPTPQTHQPNNLSDPRSTERIPIESQETSGTVTRSSIEMFARADDYVPEEQHGGEEHYSFRLEEMRNLLSGASAAMCFDGDPESFEIWRNSITSSLKKIKCGPEQCVKILLNNTRGEPHKELKKLLRCGMSHSQILRQAWCTLRAKFGNDITIAQSMIQSVLTFKKMTDSSRGDRDHSNNVKLMEDYYDLCHKILINREMYPDLEFFNGRYGQDLILDKMCPGFISEWEAHASYLKRTKGIHRPTLEQLLALMDEYIDRKSYPYVTPASQYGAGHATRRNFAARAGAVSPSTAANLPSLLQLSVSPPSVTNNQTSVARSPSSNSSSVTPAGVPPVATSLQTGVPQSQGLLHCPQHRENGHSLENCPTYLSWEVTRRRDFVARSKLCFLCLLPHFVRDCSCSIPCSVSGCTERHHSTLHLFRSTHGAGGGNRRSYCQQVCGSSMPTTQACSKTVLVQVRVRGKPETMVHCYCVIDEQSNCSFADPELIRLLGVPSMAHSYTVETMAGLATNYDGHIVSDLEVCGVDGNSWISLPDTLTNPHLPDNRHEVATRSIVEQHPHIKHLAHHFPVQTADVPVLLLVGYDCGPAMDTEKHGDHFPFVHHTALGWAVVGRVCTDPMVQHSKCFRTVVSSSCEHYSALPSFPTGLKSQSDLEYDVFHRRADDEQLGDSQENTEFTRIMEEGVRQSADGHLVIPLPFKANFELPKNQASIKHRSVNTLIRIDRKPEIAEKCQETLQKYWDMGHVEQLSSEFSDNPDMVCHIPVFPVVQQKKQKVRLVFDSSAQFKGNCLNDNLLRGPNDNNRLIGVLLRFRQERVAFCADIECMYHNFRIPEEHRNALRFYWWKDNVPGSPLVPWRAKVHVFGNKSSPAVAVFGLRYTTRQPIAADKPEASKFICHHFYVDDGMMSTSTVKEAIKILSDARAILSGCNLRLHKLISNQTEVLEAFPTTEHAPNLEAKDLQANSDHAALGLAWNLAADELILRYQDTPRSFTRRAVLSQNGSIFDPLGMVGPVALGGKLLQRKFLSHRTPEGPSTFDWDEPLPTMYIKEWKAWVSQLEDLKDIRIPRSYASTLNKVVQRHLHVFCDASAEAIAHVMYLQSIDEQGELEVAFVFGACRVAPKGATSIARLELCSAVEGSRASRYVTSELSFDITSVHLYTDSTIVLAYIRNKERMFTNYVTSRVAVILENSFAEQWSHVLGSVNPADYGTRFHNPRELNRSSWLSGPAFLQQGDSIYPVKDEELPSNLPEVLPLKKIKVLKTAVISSEVHRWDLILQRAGSWTKACHILGLMLLFIHRCKKNEVNLEQCYGMARCLLIRHVQMECFGDTFHKLKSKEELLESDPLLSLSPFMSGGQFGLIRVGGRLKNSPISYCERHPILLPSKHRITDLILQEAHSTIMHQGRHLTSAAVRRMGFFVLHHSAVVKRLIAACVVCRKQRGTFCRQKMADLPKERLEKIPPFLYSGVDVFGPYHIHDGKTTRRAPGSRKVWVLLCTCLYSRAIHVEVLSSLDLSTFRLALRRFFAIRGRCKLFRSDCATNFKGSEAVRAEELNLEQLAKDAQNEDYTWKFLPPGASHFAGVWERKIGSIKHIFDASLNTLQNKGHYLNREEFTTLMLEAANIVNNTPLGEVSSDANDPFPVSPSALLTLREIDEAPHPCTFSQRDLLSYGRLRWKRVDLLAEDFWQRWKADYLYSLTERRKWLKPHRSLKVGDVVLMSNGATRSNWPLGIIVDVSSDDEGLVRSVDVRLKRSDGGKIRIFNRAIHDLVLILDPTES